MAINKPSDRDPKPPSETVPKQDQGDSKPGQNTGKPAQGDTKRPS